MSAILFHGPSFVPVSGSATVYPGAKLYFYETGTSTLQNSYTDAALSVAHANPVIADANGRFAPIYLDESLERYKAVLKDSADVTLYTVDPVSVLISGANAGVITDLIAKSTTLGVVNVSGYHTAGAGGGGSYYWDSAQDKANHNGGTIIDPDITFPTDWTNEGQKTTWFTAGTGTGCWVQIVYNHVNAETFGAKGDGATNDATAIQAALDSHDSVYLPANSYLITTEILPNTNNKIFGDGDTSVITFSGSMASQSVISIQSKSNVTVKDIKIIGDQTVDAVGAGHGTGIFVSSSTNVRLIDNHITSLPLNGIQFSASTHSWATGNYIRTIQPLAVGTGGISGIDIKGASSNIIVSNNNVKTIGLAAGVSGVGIRIISDGADNNPTQITIDNNIVDTTAVHGIISYATITVASHDTRGTRIVNNTIRNTGVTTHATTYLGSSIYTLNAGGMVIANNSCENAWVNTAIGPIIEGVIGCSADATIPVDDMNVISGNSIVGSSTASIDGISVQANKVSITGNVINNVTGYGIKLVGNVTTRTEGSAVTGNNIYLCVKAGILLQYMDRVTVSGNIINDTSAQGIYTYNINGGTISGNHVVSDGTASQYGIYNQAAGTTSSGLAITGNSVLDFARAMHFDGLIESVVTSNAMEYTGSGIYLNDVVDVTIESNAMKGANTLIALETAGTNATSYFSCKQIINRSGKTTPYISNAVAGCMVSVWGDTDPASDTNGAWQIGDTVYDRSPVAGGARGWICTTAGSQGTWDTFGDISA